MGLDVAGTNYSANEGDREGVYRIVLCVTVTKMPKRKQGKKGWESPREFSPPLAGLMEAEISGCSSHGCGPGGKGSGTHYKDMPLVTDLACQLLPHEGSMLSRRAPQTRGGNFKSQACFISTRIQTIIRRGPFSVDQVSAFFETSKMEWEADNWIIGPWTQAGVSRGIKVLAETIVPLVWTS